MSNPAAVAAAIDYFTAEARNFLSVKSPAFRSKVGDIKQSSRPLSTAKAALRTLRVRYAGHPAPAPVVPEAASAVVEEAPTTDPEVEEVAEELTSYDGPATPLSLKAALVEPDAFSQGGVTVIECALARERGWIDPAERRLIARMRKAVARGDRPAWDRAVAALDYVGTHPVQPTAWRRAEREFEAVPELQLRDARISSLAEEVSVAEGSRVPDRPEEAHFAGGNPGDFEANSTSDMVLD